MLPAHIQNALNGNIKLINNAVVHAPVKTATQLKYEQTTKQFSPRAIDNACNAIDDNDYSFEYHEASEGEILTINNLE